ncbi:MAG TPA: peptidoglycan-binding domain-containing protein [Candidatus Nitrosocosmicus sp.]|nr:peptidoglycan-binding domain-containing protein [Candidatus Nitrosocosmicus sp.]
MNRIIKSSLLLSLLIISTVGVLSHFGTDLLAQTPVTTTCDPHAQTLKKGNAGEIVVTLQNLLVEKGYIERDFVDGNFGPGTEAAVKQFQTDNSLTADGIVGPATWQVLCSTAEPLSDETPEMISCPDGGSAGTSCPAETSKTSQPSVNKQITAPLDAADSIYIANKTIFLGSKNISLTPYLVTEEHSSDHGILKGVGNVTNNQTYISTHLSDELIQSTGNGTFETQDGESIAWITSAIGRPTDDGSWVFHDIILFNNTQSESLALLNNSIGLVKSTVGNEPDYIWLLE